MPQGYERRISPAYRKPDTCGQHAAGLNGGVTSHRRTRSRTHRRRAAVLLIIAAAIAAALGDQLPATPSSTAASPDLVPRREPRGALGKLDPALRAAVKQATADARRDGIALVVKSGRRSAEQQARLLRKAISKYGSAEEAARWVATPETSLHVSGDAVDIGPSDAAAWLAEHGARYGLCRTYANEPWHYELRPDAIDYGCPAMYPDPTHDPRLQP